ncbi:MAG: glycosyltransferase [Agathobacter sp.]|nr:glycosyltransferase [Agathobacter sp.]MBQ2283506.1 glycosyltransferase [Agathobacter sp.]
MREKPLVSIIMPAYNSENYMESSINSVIKQTYENWELLIIDDASSDSTREIAHKYADGEKIRLIVNDKNVGVSQSRNRGIHEAKGHWVAFLDSDDLWEPEKLGKQMDFLEKEDKARLVFTGSAFINEQGKRAEYILEVPEKVMFRRLLKQNIISCSSVVVQKELLLQYQMPGDHLHEDYSVWLRILSGGEMAYGINDPLLIYRVSTGSKSGNKWKAAKMQFRVYRYMGINVFGSLYYMMWYTFLNLRKYRNIYKTL